MNTKKTWTPPYLGAAYYPEDWPLEQMDEDIALMTEAGLNVARIAEFAWSTMEPREGEYDFGWLHTAVDKLAAADIATVMCTPSCTPPAWLSEKYPEILFVGRDGQTIGHGGRRHACPNSPVYRDHCERIIRRMCEEFGRDDRIIAWQIDNEVYGNGARPACACPVCVSKFRDSLKQRFGTIEKLNQAWCLSLWSQTYQSFDQIPPPRLNVWHHPSLLQAWERFHSDSYIDFVEHQARLLHELTDVPIGTDMMMLLGVDHYKANRELDVVQYNHYHLGEGFRDSAFWFDYIRPIKKDVPFWNTETSTCWGGGATYQEPGFCRANSWLPIVQGGEANMYWLWRTHWAGQELMHGSVISSCGRPMHVFGEVQEVAKGYEAARELINGTRPVPSGLGIHLSDTEYSMFRTQSPAEGFDYLSSVLQGIYHPTVRAQFRPDVISPCVDLDDYKLIVSPFLMTLEEDGLSDRLRRWIENGGAWIAGPLTDIRTIDLTKYTHAPFGVIEDWGGVYLQVRHPRDSPRLQIAVERRRGVHRIRLVQRTGASRRGGPRHIQRRPLRGTRGGDIAPDGPRTGDRARDSAPGRGFREAALICGERDRDQTSRQCIRQPPGGPKVRRGRRWPDGRRTRQQTGLGRTTARGYGPYHGKQDERKSRSRPIWRSGCAI